MWSLTQLSSFIEEQEQWVVCHENDCLTITNEDGIEAFLVVSGEQILVETLLFAKSQVKEAGGLNEHILKTHQLFPLITIAITTISDEDYYMAFGSLSSQSKRESVLIEIRTLFQSVTVFLDAYEDYLK